MPKGYWIAHVDVHNDEGYKAYAARQRRRSSRNSAAASSCAAANSKTRKAQARSRNVVHRVSGLCDGARLLPLAGISSQHQAAAAAFGRRSRHHRRLRRPAADWRSRSSASLPAIPAASIRRRNDGRHAADRGRGWRPHGPHADQGHRRDQGPRARRRGRRRWLAARLARTRATRRARRHGVSSPATPRRSSTRPTASSTSPCRPRPSRSRRSPPRPAIVHVVGTTGCSADETRRSPMRRKTRGHRQVGQYEPRRQSAGGADKRVAKTLDADFDIEVLEMHHNQKIDAPSGTALLLGQAAAQGRGIDLKAHGAAATAIPARASRATSASPRCAAAPWSATTR